MRSEFEEWYEKWTGSKVKCENYDVRGAWQHQQAKIDELQKRVDVQTKHIETALLAVKDIHKSALDEFMEWDVLAEKAPKLCEHLQNLSVAVGELEQALNSDKKKPSN